MSSGIGTNKLRCDEGNDEDNGGLHQTPAHRLLP
jgi:hypothetical protein